MISPFIHRSFRFLTSHLEDGLSQALDIAGRDTSHGNTAVLGRVDGVLETSVSAMHGGLIGGDGCQTYLLGQSVHLLGLETGESKHSDLGKSD